MRRTDGENGWKKIPCPWSQTGWAWGKDYLSGVECTCSPCRPPKEPSTPRRALDA